MKNIFSIILASLVLLSSCSQNPSSEATQLNTYPGVISANEDALENILQMPSTEETTNISSDNPKTERYYLDSDMFPILQEERPNFELYTSNEFEGYYYVIYDNQHNFMEDGFCSWRLHGITYVENSLLAIKIGSGISLFSTKYYDVEKGRISRFFSQPRATSGSLVAYFETDDNGTKLVIQDMFDETKYYQEFYDKSFTSCVYTMYCPGSFSSDNKSVTVDYSDEKGKIISKTFELP